MANCNNLCSSNVIGPLTYRYSGFGTSSRSNCGCATNYCGCTKCDVNLEFDYGTRGLIKIDWTKTLKKKGACVITNSKWRLNKTAAVDLVYDDQSYTDSHTLIYVSGGIYSGEYELINEITTERGDTLRQTVCIKLAGSDCGNSIPIDPVDPCPVIPVDNSCNKNGFIMQGSYHKTSFCHQAYCKIIFRLLEGCSRVYYKGNFYELQMTEPLIIETDNLDLNEFIIEVDCDSKVMYELEQKE